VSAVLAALQGVTVSTVALLALFVGFCVVFTLPKLRRAGAPASGAPLPRKLLRV